MLFPDNYTFVIFKHLSKSFEYGSRSSKSWSESRLGLNWCNRLQFWRSVYGIYIASSTTVEELYQYARLTFVRLCKTNDRRIRPADVDKPVADVTDWLSPVLDDKFLIALFRPWKNIKQKDVYFFFFINSLLIIPIYEMSCVVLVSLHTFVWTTSCICI